MPDKMTANFDQDPAGWQRAAGKLGTLWCEFMHDSTMWPIHGRYQCGTCHRVYDVPWSADKAPAIPGSLLAAGPARFRQASVPSFRSILLPLVMMLALLAPARVRAAEAAIAASPDPAGTAFARYIAGLEQATPWNLENVEIDASLPNQKHGRLRAIRRLLPFGKPEYQVLEMAGDQTVRQQVIVRYLTAEARAAAMPASAVAITPANYKFRYNGVVRNGETVAYSFLITPHKKRDGLIKGELWIDADTGVAVRQTGHLVKRPSFFVKRIDVTREVALHDGNVEMRVTHLTVDTRLVGRATLTVQEYPYTAPADEPALYIAER